MNTEIDKKEKDPVYDNLILEVPNGIGEIIHNHRNKLQINQKTLSERLKLRGRVAISEYENDVKDMSNHTWTLMAIALNLHPNTPANSFYDEELVFDMNPVPKGGYGQFITDAMAKQGMSFDELADKVTFFAGGISREELQALLDGEISKPPRAIHWVKIQLALNTFVSGFRAGDEILRRRKEKGWTQSDLAGVLEVNKQTISKYEAGHSIPGNHIWALIMLALDFHPHYRVMKQDIITKTAYRGEESVDQGLSEPA